MGLSSPVPLGSTLSLLTVRAELAAVFGLTQLLSGSGRMGTGY